MEMSIDEAISWLVSITEHEGEDIPIYDDDVKAISVAIDTMRKYQKIEQIIRIYDTPWEFHTLRGTVDKIREVIEDGNN